MTRQRRALLLALISVWLGTAAQAAVLQVVTLTPARISNAAPSTAISIEFDRALNPATITPSSFRVFGRASGAKSGAYAFSNGNKTVALTPTRPFSAGETVWVNLSHDIAAADATPMRAAGYAYQFGIQTVPSSRTFNQLALLSNRSTPSTQTRIYGAMSSDLNEDGYLDLATVNEVSADVRVFLNRADGSGQFNNFLTPVPIGIESSPNEPADFNHDGHVDMCISATDSGSVWVLLGAGNGTFSSVQEVPVGSEPHGIAVLDVDGDGDLDIVNANNGSNNLSLLINNGSGTFSAPTFFDGGVNGEYGLAAGDMNGDGITDLVVGGRDGQEIAVMLGNGDGTFTAAGPAQSSGGLTWVVTLGDVNGDGKLDASCANSTSNNGAILLGNGDGTFGTPAIMPTGAHTPSTDLGDMDGDGDLDWVLSSFGGGFWRMYTNDGNGNFTFDQQFTAPSNPSCAILYDADNDGDLDMALTDEIADVAVLMQNVNASACTATPQACRMPTASGKAHVRVKNNATDDARDALSWKWTKGAATTKAEFGNPLVSDDYELCFYDGTSFIYSVRMPKGQICGTRACWKDLRDGFSYADKDVTPNGVRSMRLKEGLTPGTATIAVKGKSAHLGLPDFTAVTGPLQIQLQRTGSAVCWGATFSAPFDKNDGVSFSDASD